MVQHRWTRGHVQAVRNESVKFRNATIFRENSLACIEKYRPTSKWVRKLFNDKKLWRKIDIMFQYLRYVIGPIKWWSSQGFENTGFDDFMTDDLFSNEGIRNTRVGLFETNQSSIPHQHRKNKVSLKLTLGQESTQAMQGSVKDKHIFGQYGSNSWGAEFVKMGGWRAEKRAQLISTVLHRTSWHIRKRISCQWA